MRRAARSERMRRLLDGIAAERLPCALVDMEALESNLQRLIAASQGQGSSKPIRVATKSIRSVGLLKRIAELGGTALRGWMTYSVEETAFLARHGLDDFLVAYPTLSPRDATHLVELNETGRRVVQVVDCVEQVAALGRIAAARSQSVQVAIDIDLSWRPARSWLHFGVRRSPVRSPEDAVALARAIRATPGVTLAGILAYEAQIAGLTDRNPFTRFSNPVKRALKRFSRSELASRRAAVVYALHQDGFVLEIVNGGGTGSIHSTPSESAVTEVTLGSGLYCSHLFDYYDGLELEPAAFFALQVVRQSDAGFVTCHGGGYVASGEPGPDRLPRPVFPEGLELVGLEGAGEVQTPLRLRPGAESTLPALGHPVLFRHAKAGELCEHFNELLLFREGKLIERVPTYRGDGQCFV